MDKSKVVKQLRGKFKCKDVKETNHNGLAFYYEGKRIATTRFSRGSSNVIPDSILKRMADQLYAPDLKYFKEMINCTKSYDEYVELLKSDGYIS